MSNFWGGCCPTMPVNWTVHFFRASGSIIHLYFPFCTLNWCGSVLLPRYPRKKGLNRFQACMYIICNMMVNVDEVKKNNPLHFASAASFGRRGISSRGGPTSNQNRGHQRIFQRVSTWVLLRTRVGAPGIQETCFSRRSVDSGYLDVSGS